MSDAIYLKCQEVKYQVTEDESFSGFEAEVIEAPVAPVLVEKTITENGEYSAADDEADGYSKVNVTVS